MCRLFSYFFQKSNTFAIYTKFCQKNSPKTEGNPVWQKKPQTRRGPLGWVKRHKKLTIFLVIVLVAALVLVNVLRKTDKAAAAGSYQFVRTTVLTKTTLSDTVSVTGNGQGRQQRQRHGVGFRQDLQGHGSQRRCR